MTTIKGMLDRVNLIDLESELPAIVERTEEQILDLNREQLYLHGVDSKGETLDPYRNKYYANKKNSMNPNPGWGNPDLYLTGYFHSEFYMRFDGDVFTIWSNDGKTIDLVEKYGEDIFGWTDESRDKYVIETLGPQIKLYIETVTGLKFE